MKVEPRSGTEKHQIELSGDAFLDCVLRVKFSDGGYLGKKDLIEISRAYGSVRLVVISKNRLPVCRVIPKRTWNRLLKRLFNDLRIHEWEREYADWTILDGEQWSLEVQMTKGDTLKIIGSNAYPPRWKDLLQLFKPFLDECISSKGMDLALDQMNYFASKAMYELRNTLKDANVREGNKWATRRSGRR